MTGLIAVLAVAAAAAACDGKVGNEADEASAGGDPANSTVPASAEGKAEEGRFSVKAPGFDLKFDIPDGMAQNAEFDSDSEVVYPGATFSGMHIEAGERGAGGDNSAVELRFTSADAPDKIAAWYRDPARAEAFAIVSAARDGDGFVISGRQAKEGDTFKVRLAPRGGGGTDGRLILDQQG
ncbi:MAG TPA: hypothetical protein VGW34_06365 [Allosphingosinicella sp.]|nr:hypothetical protein [Allosphingosinicella sp.]